MSKAGELQLGIVVLEGRSGSYRLGGVVGRHHTANTSKDFTSEAFLHIVNRVKLEESSFALMRRLWSETFRPRAVEATPYWIGAVTTVKEKSVGDIANVISSVFEQISSAGPGAFDQALKQIDIQAANEYLLVAVLRAASPHRKRLSGWSETQVVQRFWLVNLLAAMVGIALALLKGR
jgi:UDP-N-acetylmuramyl pentapeptide phosphotransferase/UDP-N-acetylglucosamine-1-phosphate transferase